MTVTPLKIGIAGAGIAGRLLAWRLARIGHEVELFDREPQGSREICSFAAAGILAPLAEVEQADAPIYRLGNRGLALWPDILEALGGEIFFRQPGTLIAAHGKDRGDLKHFETLVRRHLPESEGDIVAVDLRDREPALAHLGAGLYLEQEAQLDPEALMVRLESVLTDLGVVWHYGVEVPEVQPGQLKLEDGQRSFDWAADCRGLGARPQTPELRAVRGELVWLHAPDVDIKHMVRLMHPRYRIYLVPRPGNIYLVGATEIESDDCSPISVRSGLELLSAAYSLHSGFAEARIIKTVSQCRPAMPDNMPLLEVDDGLIRINGLYRHGFLLAPALIEDAVIRLSHQTYPVDEELYSESV